MACQSQRAGCAVSSYLISMPNRMLCIVAIVAIWCHLTTAMCMHRDRLLNTCIAPAPTRGVDVKMVELSRVSVGSTISKFETKYGMFYKYTVSCSSPSTPHILSVSPPSKPTPHSNRPIICKASEVVQRRRAIMASAGPKVAVPKNVVLETNMGTITVELYFKHAPATCKNFSELARRGYYNGTVFHRIIKVSV